MPIRITGMNSGLDTEAIITQLASARSVKVNSLKKAQIKQQWTQDAWKDLNKKIYSFYTDTLSDMQYVGNYAKKKTTISDPTKASVTTTGTAVNGTQYMSVQSLAKAAYLTGGKLDDFYREVVSADMTAVVTSECLYQEVREGFNELITFGERIFLIIELHAAQVSEQKNGVISVCVYCLPGFFGSLLGSDTLFFRLLGRFFSSDLAFYLCSDLSKLSGRQFGSFVILPECTRSK